MSSSDYKLLTVWQKSMDLTVEIYRLVKFLPKEETYALSDQMRRAAVSIPSNIAEGHGRSTAKEFIKLLTISRGSVLEIETQIELCNRLNLINIQNTVYAKSLIVEINKMLNSLIVYLNTIK